MMDVVNNPEDPAAGTRKVPFGRVLYIEQDDFLEDPPKKFFRLAPGREVRLRNAYLVTCQSVVKNDAGEVVELHCTYDPATRGGDAPDGRKVKATLHWVSAAHAIDAEVRLYDRLFTHENPGTGDADFLTQLNPQSLEVDSRREARAVTRRSRGGRPLSVRTAWVLLRGSGYPRWCAGVQSDGDAERLVGEGGTDYLIVTVFEPTRSDCRS